MGKRLWDLAKSRFEIATILLGHRYIVLSGLSELRLLYIHTSKIQTISDTNTFVLW